MFSKIEKDANRVVQGLVESENSASINRIIDGLVHTRDIELLSLIKIKLANHALANHDDAEWVHDILSDIDERRNENEINEIFYPRQIFCTIT